MKRFFLLFYSLLLAEVLQAQTPVRHNSIRIGVDLTTLDAPDALGPRYVGRLARHFANDRLLIAAEAGYMQIRSQNVSFNDVDPGHNERKRLTAEATALVDLLRHPRHALRIGAGFSAWYKRDDIFRSARATFTTGGLQSVAIDRQLRSGVDTGIHFATEYEWLFDERWGADVRLRLVNMGNAGINSVLGAGINHHF